VVWLTGLGHFYNPAFAAAVVKRLGLGPLPAWAAICLYLLFAGTTGMASQCATALGEEIGWRGFALPRLAEHLGWGGASILLGVIWACWHLPLFLLSGFDTTGQSFLLYLLQVTAVSVALAWLYARTGGSLLLTMLMHAATNNTKDIVPSAVPGATNPFALSTSLVAWLTVALLWIGALIFLRTMPSARSSAAAPDAGRRGA
jgi:membrane protease YdiL (CAAX protease family)